MTDAVLESPRLPAFAARIARLAGWRRALAAVLAGIVATLAMPPVDLPPAMLVALPVLFWLADGARGPGAAFLAGTLWGLGHFCTGLYWIVFAYLVPPADFALMGPPTVFGLALLLAVFVGAAMALYRLLAARFGTALASPWRRVLLFALCFVVFEWLRGHVMTGFPWNQIGHAWTISDAMSQSAALVGIYGLSLFSLLVFTLPAAGLRPTAAAFALLLVLAGAGALRLAGDDKAEQPGVYLRIVQPNVAQSEKWLPALANAHFDKTLRLSALPSQRAVTHLVWPETAVSFPLAPSELHRAAIAQVTPQDGYVLLGATRAAVGADGRREVFNSLHAVDARGQIVADYDKFHLVPLGEYLPLRDWLPLEDTVGRGSFEAGPGPRTLRLAGMPAVSPLICYEIIFPGAVVDRTDRPDWLLNVTNDAWFGLSSGPHQHLANARMRAIEEGLPLVRSANTGISAVIDPYGRTLARLELEKAGVIDSALPAPLDPTVYARFGDWAFVGLLVLVGLAVPLRRRSSDRPG